MGASPNSLGPSSAAGAPMPPLPDLSTTSGGNGVGTNSSDSANPLAAMLSGIMPTKMAVDQILAAAKQIVQAGNVPGAEQVCGQIVALATSLLPMAAQAGMAGLGGGLGGSPASGPGPGMGGIAPGPPTSGPQPILGGGQ